MMGDPLCWISSVGGGGGGSSTGQDHPAQPSQLPTVRQSLYQVVVAVGEVSQQYLPGVQSVTPVSGLVSQQRSLRHAEHSWAEAIGVKNNTLASTTKM